VPDYNKAATVPLRFIFGLTLFVSSFLLFQIQPITAKWLLPQFGGVASVWIGCLLAFQVLLAAGYAYAALARPWIHALLLAACAATVPASPSFAVAAPYVALASSAPLLQRWSGGSYRFYGLSNAASLLALLTYPFLVEPATTLPQQWAAWRLGFWIFAALGVGLTILLARDAAPAPQRFPGLRPLLMPATLAALGAALLAAFTEQLCQEIAPVPLLWVLPLALYLATYIYAFARLRVHRTLWLWLLVPLIPATCVVQIIGLSAPLWMHFTVDVATLFVALMLCHGELAERRMDDAASSFFYLALAIGGALGTLGVAVAAPLWFSGGRFELPVLLALVPALGLWPYRRTVQQVGLAFAVFSAVAAIVTAQPDAIETRRNLYGYVQVSDHATRDGRVRRMTHGQTMHGAQMLEEAKSLRPTTYYGEASGIGYLIKSRAPKRLGVVGLGAGTLAAYGVSTVFYELNPDVAYLARTHFTFLRNRPVEIVLGDARMSLGAEPPRHFDILALDAFSSDSIPTHLLTVEAGAVYRRHLAPGGVLAVHISNRALDLEPVVRGLARAWNAPAWRIENDPGSDDALARSTWMIVEPGLPARPTNQPVVTWTDSYASLWPLVKPQKLGF
jgi:hypothetical protein